MKNSKRRAEAIKAYKTRIADIMKYGKISEHGLTIRELQSYFTDQVTKVFDKWINGQTCALTDDGDIVVYAHDIDRFIGLLIYNQSTYWD